ncbi:hypothetical protein M0R45_016504 [Rubus argutus]|uniref:Uncharacterized protein n=1 Tax=Rubus argutus TaxID=59490 RepID=A0AAW1XUR8_RUBAR
MSSHSIHHLFLSVLPSLPSSNSLSNNDQPNKHLPGVWLFGAKGKRFLHSVCIAVSKPHTRYVVKCKNHMVAKDGTQEDEEDASIKIIKEHMDSIKSMLSSMEDGEISISAYDTAWVALVEDVNGTGFPQFPSSLEWIANNQLEDGSWGYKEIFSVHDRIISTLACVIALKSWNFHLEKCDKARHDAMLLIS